MAPIATTYLPSENDLAAAFKESAPGSCDGNTPSPPLGFPSVLQSKLDWTRERITQDIDKCITKLTAADIEALETASELKDRFRDAAMDKFPLPQDLVKRLRKVSNQCYHGRGFAIIQGLDPTRYTREQNVAIHAGIAAHIAPHHGFINRARTKVIDLVSNSGSEATYKPPGFTDDALAFHNDCSEILSLYALNSASEGGETYVSSGYRLYNDLVKTRPDVLRTLAEDWVIDTFKDHSKYPPITRPMLHNVDLNNVSFTFSRYPMTGYKTCERHPSLPLVTDAQREAMDVVQYTAAKNAIPLPWAQGDIVFINDMAIFHARSSFKEEGAKRRLLKFYLRDPEQRQHIPQTARDTWVNIYGPNMADGSRNEDWDECYDSDEGRLSNG